MYRRQERITIKAQLVLSSRTPIAITAMSKTNINLFKFKLLGWSLENLKENIGISQSIRMQSRRLREGRKRELAHKAPKREFGSNST